MERRVESKTSRTAEFTCLMRFQSYLEKREQYKSEDYMTQVIVNSMIKTLFKLAPVRNIFLKKVYPAGMYEYVIARTKFMDSAVKKALQEGIEQVLVFGAGFDSRGIRFHDISPDAVFYELDAPATQTAKIGRYREKGIELPKNLVFIPIDFEKQSICERLLESGFQKGRKSLFLLEGLTMYLDSDSLDNTLRIVRDFAGQGSIIIFDHIYASVLRGENLYKGEKELVRSVSKEGEGFHFGIEKGSAREFLSSYGFEVMEITDSNALEELYFKDVNGRCPARVNGTHCIVTAKRIA